MKIVIPSYKEEYLFDTIHSLGHCNPVEENCEVILVLNCSDKEEEIQAFHKRQQEELREIFHPYASKKFSLIVLNEVFPLKQAGVGLARKTGMDLAQTNCASDEVIVCLDADCTVSENYLEVLSSHFNKNPSCHAASIYFEHPFSEEMTPRHLRAITEYEIFLRYYVQALRAVNYPFSYHTVGSSMAVRASTYHRQGGMNKRKAGEDFYFLHKVIPLGNFKDITECSVYPSPRSSLRVPFGTGRAVNYWLNTDEKVYPGHDLRSFFAIGELCKLIMSAGTQKEMKKMLPSLPESISTYLEQEDFMSAIIEAGQNSSTSENFQKRLFKWFNGFRVMKFLHFSRDSFYDDKPLNKEALRLLHHIKKAPAENSADAILSRLRELDKTGDFTHPLF